MELQDFIEKLAAEDSAKYDEETNLSKINFVPDPIRVGDLEFSPYGLFSFVRKYTGIFPPFEDSDDDEESISSAVSSEDAFKIVGKTAIPTAMVKWLITFGHSDVLCEYLNDSVASFIRQNSDKTVVLRVRTTSDNKLVRVVVSDRYDAVDNYPLMATYVAPILNVDSSFHNIDVGKVYDNSDEMSAFIVDDQVHNLNGQDYMLGVGVSNSEVGRWRISISPAVVNLRGGNNPSYFSFKGTKFKVSKKHVGVVEGELKKQIAFCIQNAAREGELLLEIIDRATSYGITDEQIPYIVELFRKEHNIPVNAARKWLKNIKNESPHLANTAWGLVNALVDIVQSSNTLDKEFVDTCASGILCPSLDTSENAFVSHWNRIIDASKRIKKQDVEYLASVR